MGIRAEARRASRSGDQKWRTSRSCFPAIKRTCRFREVASPLAKLPDETVIDREIVALDENGRPSPGALQNGSPGAALRFFVFDLLFIGGRDVHRVSLEKRRQLLCEELMPTMPEIICCWDTLEASAVDVVAAVKEQGLEGVSPKGRTVITKWADVRAPG